MGQLGEQKDQQKNVGVITTRVSISLQDLCYPEPFCRITRSMTLMPSLEEQLRMAFVSRMDARRSSLQTPVLRATRYEGQACWWPWSVAE